ncbi:MAG: 50S ribosomal protein L11 methyltransferase [Pirellulaceae bacterium]
MDNYLKPYGDIELQRRMVSDRPRTNAFAAAIRQVVRPGDVVLDVGTGTGILAMLAAQAGARKIYAIDATDIAEVATALVQVNGLADRIHVLQGRAGELHLEQKVDLIMSEWLGNAAFAEGMLHAVLEARDHNLAPTGRMLPSTVRVLIAPLDEPILYHTEGPGFWREPIHGLDFSSLQEMELSQGRTTQIRVDPAALLAAGQTLLELDLLTASAEDAWSERELEFVSLRDGVLNGFCVWFEADLSPQVTLDTGPLSPETHWAQTYLSFSPRPVRAGQRVVVNVDFSYDPDPADVRRHVDLRVEVGQHELNYLIE